MLTRRDMIEMVLVVLCACFGFVIAMIVAVVRVGLVQF